MIFNKKPSLLKCNLCASFVDMRLSLAFIVVQCNYIKREQHILRTGALHNHRKETYVNKSQNIANWTTKKKLFNLK